MVIKDTAAANLSDAQLSELRNESIGFVFQNFNLVPVLIALENVMLPLQVLNYRHHLDLILEPCLLLILQS